MSSLFDRLNEKVARDQGVGAKRGVSTFDLTLLMFNQREATRDLWAAADEYVRSHDASDLGDLAEAVEKLRPIFGEQAQS